MKQGAKNITLAAFVFAFAAPFSFSWSPVGPVKHSDMAADVRSEPLL
jgi:hypothetical protein